MIAIRQRQDAVTRRTQRRPAGDLTRYPPRPRKAVFHRCAPVRVRASPPHAGRRPQRARQQSASGVDLKEPAARLRTSATSSFDFGACLRGQGGEEHAAEFGRSKRGNGEISWASEAPSIPTEAQTKVRTKHPFADSIFT